MVIKFYFQKISYICQNFIFITNYNFLYKLEIYYHKPKIRIHK